MTSPSTIPVYPSSLPKPANTLTFVPVERRFSFGGNTALRFRAFEEGFRAVVKVEFIYTGAQAAVFRSWWELNLELGFRKFIANWPNAEGFTAAIYRFRPNTIEWKCIGFEVFSVTAECSVRVTLQALAALKPCVLPRFASHFDGTDGGTSTLDVAENAITFSGAASLSALVKKFGDAAVNIPASDAVSKVVVTSPLFGPGQNDFVFRGWVYGDNSGATSDGTLYTMIDTRDGGKAGFSFGVTDFYRISYTGKNPANELSLGLGAAWQFLEIYRISGILNVYFGGTLALSEHDGRYLDFDTIRFGGTSALPRTWYADDWEFYVGSGSFVPYGNTVPVDSFVAECQGRLIAPDPVSTVSSDGRTYTTTSNSRGAFFPAYYRSTDAGTGLRYIEWKIIAGDAAQIGMIKQSSFTTFSNTAYSGNTYGINDFWGVTASNFFDGPQKWEGVLSTTIADFTHGDIIGVLVDFSTLQMYIFKNGAALASTTLPTAHMDPYVTFYGNGQGVDTLIITSYPTQTEWHYPQPGYLPFAQTVG